MICLKLSLVSYIVYVNSEVCGVAAYYAWPLLFSYGKNWKNSDTHNSSNVVLPYSSYASEWKTVLPRPVDGKRVIKVYGSVGATFISVEGLNKVAKKLDIDCAPAMVGWDHHCGFSHPRYSKNLKNHIVRCRRNGKQCRP